MGFWCWTQPHSCKKKPFQEGLLDHVWTRWLVISAISSYFWKIRHDDMMLFFLSKHVQNILGQDWELHLPTGLWWWKPHVLGRLSGLVQDAESRRKHCFAMKKWLEMVVSPRMQLNRTYRFHNVSSPSMLLAFLQSVMEVPWLSRIITLENGHLNSQTVPCRRWNHRSRSLDQFLVVYKSTFLYLNGFWWFWLDLNGCPFRFGFVPLQDFPTEDGCRATSQVGPVTPPKQYSKQMLKGHYEIKHNRPCLQKQGEVHVKQILVRYYSCILCCTQIVRTH